MEQKRYNLVVIGAGPGGYEAAVHAAKSGMSVAVVEESYVGGTCLNRGCIPTKALLHSAKIYLEAKEGEKKGVLASGITFDLAKMHERKDAVVLQLRGGIEKLLKSCKVDLYCGRGRIAGEKCVEVTAQSGEVTTLLCDNVLIATGSKPLVPNIQGIKEVKALTSDDILKSAEKCPESLTIIGGGVIGIEFASFYNMLGCSVTIIEAMDRVLPTLDREISQSITMILKKRGVKVITGARVTKLSNSDGKIVSTFTAKDKEESVESDELLIAIGRRANTEGLFDEGFIETERGQIKVNDKFMTSREGIYAIGDVIFGGIQLAHVATAQGINAVHAMQGKEMPINMNIVPSCIFTYPEIASVGITADEAKAQGIEIKTAKFPMGANGKTVIETEDRGFVKIISRADNGVILGAQLMCPCATDMINELSLAIAKQLTLSDIAHVIHPHPTFGEAICDAAKAGL